ncbi:valyl-tRNA synthetase [Chromobacterium violaceum]|uniref:Valyl-tRNA synthetase n=1 Tax=Chromobacterium violaceum TaxID=536 RepID=A0A447TEL3_CHRVL|nr:valyl-tRNA synthetase [Chromobacterium violaceum]
MPYLKLLARLTEGTLVAKLPEDDSPVAISGEARLMLKVEVDKAAETARLTKEQGKVEAELAKLTAKLEKPGYVDKARRIWWSAIRRRWRSLPISWRRLKRSLLSWRNSSNPAIFAGIFFILDMS